MISDQKKPRPKVFSMGFPFLSTALISGLNGFGDEEYTLFLKNRIGGRLQLPDDMKLRTRSFLYFRHHFFFLATVHFCSFILEATVHTLY